jgi:hypothetical protein
MRAFWDAATALNSDAVDLRQDKRFPYCTRDGLTDMAENGRTDLDWHPFTFGAGPAPGCC